MGRQGMKTIGDEEQIIDFQCETCDGAGTIDERLGGEFFSNPAAPCPDCDGVGIITNQTEGAR